MAQKAVKSGSEATVSPAPESKAVEGSKLEPTAGSPAGSAVSTGSDSQPVDQFVEQMAGNTALIYESLVKTADRQTGLSVEEFALFEAYQAQKPSWSPF